MNRETVALAGLLHDIGKIIYRALEPSDRRGYRHQELGYNWAKERGLPPEIQETIRRHHAVRPSDPKYQELAAEAYQGATSVRNLIYLVAEADNIAAGMERQDLAEEGGFEIEQGLGVVFDRVGLDHTPAQRHLWEPVLLDKAPYPAPASEIPGPRILAFYRSAWKGLRESLADPANLQEDRLLLLLEKYLGSVPEHSRATETSWPDTSLYHHLKTTAALSWCGYLYLREAGRNWEEDDLMEVIGRRDEPRYLLVGADLSGIQNFIYTIGSKAALKTLRARSFFLDLLVESAATQLLRALELGRSHLIYASGGGFFLVAPNTAPARRQLAAFSEGFNAWLAQNFGTALHLCTAVVALSGADLAGKTGRLQQAWGEVHRELQQKKSRKWEAFLSRDPEAFLDPRPVERECQVCHRAGGVETVITDGEEYELCPFCRLMMRLGQSLPEQEGFYETEEGSPTGLALTIYQATYSFTDQPPKELRAEYRLKCPWSLSSGNWPVRPFPAGSYYTHREFSKLAASAVGDKKIGVLRLDVDRLGQLFARGLRQATFARMSDLSARLNLYFKYYLPRLLDQPAGGLLPLEPRRLPVNVVYAGGDDLFLVGAWDAVMEAAYAISRDFGRYVGFNPDLTVSGGIVVADEKVALYRLADLAAAAEARAKDAGRNRLCVAGVTLTWAEVDELRSYLSLFGSQMVQEGLAVKPMGFSRGFLQRFAALVEEYCLLSEESEKAEAAGAEAATVLRARRGRAWVYPELYYLFARAKAAARSNSEEEFYKKFLAVSLSEKALTRLLPPALRILKLMLRGARENAAD